MSLRPDDDFLLERPPLPRCCSPLRPQDCDDFVAPMLWQLHCCRRFAAANAVVVFDLLPMLLLRC